MNTNEKLIEEAAKAIHEALLAKGGYRGGAEAALAVLEKAHTPTDDELDALSTVIAKIREGFYPEGLGVVSNDNLAHAILAAGFRRSEVPEPSADEHEIVPTSPTGRIDSPVTCKTCDRALFIGTDGEWEHVPRPEPQGEPSDAPKRLVYEVNMILSSVASHGPAALTDTSDRMYTTGLLRRLRDALDPKPAHRLAAGNAVRAEMARNGLDVHRMVYGQEIANVLAGAALDAALRAAGGVR